MKEKNVIGFLYEYLVVTIGTLGVAGSVYFFMLPSNLTVGSASALAMIISTIIPVRVSVISFFVNGILMIIGLIFVGKDFGAKTVYSTFLVSGFLYIFEILFPLKGSLTGDLFVDMICYVILVSVSQAILFNANASSGGIDVMAKILNKYLGMELGKAMSTVGLLVACGGFFLYETSAVIISILGTYLGGIVLDYYIGGFTVKKKVSILSEDPDGVQEYIMGTLKKGCTLYSAVGAYNHEVRTEVVSILNRNEYVKLMDHIHKNDPTAFMTVSSITEVHDSKWDSVKGKRFVRKGKE